MKFTDYLDALNLTLNIKRFPNQEERWSCSIEGAKVKGDGVLMGVYGDGHDPVTSVNDYILRIKEKTLVFNAHDGEKRREFKVPSQLIYETYNL